MSPARKAWAKLWPWVGAGGFWFAGLLQAAAILRAKDAGSVSSGLWLIGAAVLVGYALYYGAFLDREAKRSAVIVSLIGATLYLSIFFLTIIY